MTRRPNRIEATGLFLCVLLSGCRRSPANPKAVEQQFELAIPPHSTQAQVLNYLDSQKMPHSPYHRDETSGNVIETGITMKSPRAWVGPDYGVLFQFDERGLLLRVNVDYLGYIGL